MHQILLDIVDELFPLHCLVCERRLRSSPLCTTCTPRRVDMHIKRCSKCMEPSETGLCETCGIFPLPYKEMKFMWSYEDKVRDIITRIKYRPSRALARKTVGLLREALPNMHLDLSYDLIVPVPSSIESILFRGFNFCDLLAHEVSNYLGIPRVTALRLGKSRRPQASLPLRRRTEGIRSLFVLPKPLDSSPNILLIDDVVTTGATSLAATSVLLAGGAAEVGVLSLARSSAWGQFRAKVSQAILCSAATSKID